MNKLIKMYGERNTNTNYMSKLIELNLCTEEILGTAPEHIVKLQKNLPGRELVRDIYFNVSYRYNLGWKHTCVKPAHSLKKYTLANNVSFITITKNPYSWLLSLYNKPYHQYYDIKPDFKTFLQMPWKCVLRDNTAKVLSSPIELWNIKNESYLELLNFNALNITTESIFQNPEDIISQISTHFKIERCSSSFINFEKSTKDPNKNSEYYKEYYLKEKWKNKINSNEIEIINKSIDKKLMSYFGYEILK